MMKWRQWFGFGERAEARAAANAPLRAVTDAKKPAEVRPAVNDHPDFDAETGTWKRKLWTPEEHNLHAEEIGARCYPDFTFDRPELKALRDLWFSIAERKKALPARADFEAARIEPYLPHITFVDCVAQRNARSRYRIRQQGSEIMRLFGDLTERYFDEYFPRENLPRWLMGYDVVIDAGVPLRFITRFELPLLSHLSGEALSAPLAGEGDTARGILSALYVKPMEGVVAASE